MIHGIIGFMIAVAMGLTGIGGGSLTVPALVLMAGLPVGEAVGTAFVFAGVLRLIAAPFYMLKQQVGTQYLWTLLQGAVPGLLIGTYALKLLSHTAGSPAVIILLGILLVAASSLTFAPGLQNPEFARKNVRALSWLALPIGIEAGFSSAGAGALGTVLLLNYSEMPPAQVVGTDMLFGLVLAVIGSVFHLAFGSISGRMLTQLLAGGVPGVLLGCALAHRVPARRLRTAIATIAMLGGLQLVWSGMQGARLISSSPESFIGDQIKRALKKIDSLPGFIR